MAEEERKAGEDHEGRDMPLGWRFAPAALIVIGLAVCYALGWHRYISLAVLDDNREALRAFVESDTLVAAAIFLAFYVLAATFSFPASSILTVFGGFLFGSCLGAALSIVGATTGATLLFLAIRTAFGNVFRSTGGTLGRLGEGFRRDAFSYLLVLRLAPFVPFFLVNIAPGLLNVGLRTFVAATLIGKLPGTLAFAWLGQGLEDALAAARAAGRQPAMADLATRDITISLLVLALVTLLAAVVKKLHSRRIT